ncbi:MAG: hypothetical protein QOF90_2233 [Acetobacteraceae bacterium]|jgi:hypothetical protein|nr:hypothetical protein [Acetobacteraceae bacterium]MEA2792339.1 hypothetical protein [Acetobacteraceae bacterium]
MLDEKNIGAILRQSKKNPKNWAKKHQLRCVRSRWEPGPNHYYYAIGERGHYGWSKYEFDRQRAPSDRTDNAALVEGATNDSDSVGSRHYGRFNME